MTEPQPMKLETSLKVQEWPKVEDLPHGAVFSLPNSGRIWLRLDETVAGRVRVVLLKDYAGNPFNTETLTPELIPEIVFKATLRLETLQ